LEYTRPQGRWKGRPRDFFRPPGQAPQRDPWYVGAVSSHHHHDSEHHAVHPSEVPEGQRIAAMLTHLAGILFLFFPGLIVWIQTRNEPVDSWLAHQAKEALNFQFTVTALFAICGMLGWTVTAIGLRIFPVVIAFDWLFAIIAAVGAARGTRYVYPIKVGFIR
jgi:uncharacterized Tic20 family protein